MLHYLFPLALFSNVTVDYQLQRLLLGRGEADGPAVVDAAVGDDPHAQAVRSLAALLPPIEIAAGSAYNLPPAEGEALPPDPARGPAYQQAATEAGLPAIEEIPWREFFTDRRLQRLIEIALENNRDLRLTALNVEKARAFYGIRRAELFPAVDAAAYGTKYRTPADLSSSGKGKISERYDVNLGIVAWEIDFFGRIRSLEDSALEQFLASEPLDE